MKAAEHSALIERTEALVDKLATRMRIAQGRGDLSFINQEYRARRLSARERGEPFPPYRAMQARLRKALVDVAAGGSPAIVTTIFDTR